MPRVVGLAAGAAVWVRRMHPKNKIHQLRTRLPKISDECSKLLAVSPHGAVYVLVRVAGMRYAAIHGRQKKAGVDGGGTHAAADGFDFSDARRGPFRSYGTNQSVAGPALRSACNVDADSRDRNDVQYVPKRSRPGPDRNTSSRACFTLHLCPQRISDCPCAASVPLDDSAKLGCYPRRLY